MNLTTSNHVRVQRTWVSASIFPLEGWKRAISRLQLNNGCHGTNANIEQLYVCLTQRQRPVQASRWARPPGRPSSGRGGDQVSPRVGVANPPPASSLSSFRTLSLSVLKTPLFLKHYFLALVPWCSLFTFCCRNEFLSPLNNSLGWL